MQPRLKYPDTVIQIFAKAPVPGQVNTRLVPYISTQQAADLQAELIRNRVQVCTSAQLCDVQLWCSPDSAHACFVECGSKYPLSLHRQRGADLGQRMAYGQRQALRTYRKVVTIGTDAPALQSHLIERAMILLDDHDIAIVPAEDGGYVLIAARGPFAGLMDQVDWGTHSVLERTRLNADRLGLSCMLMETCWDIDRPEDLVRYRQMLNA